MNLNKYQKLKERRIKQPYLERVEEEIVWSEMSREDKTFYQAFYCWLELIGCVKIKSLPNRGIIVKLREFDLFQKYIEFNRTGFIEHLKKTNQI